jgi:hypothetical protein
MATSKRKSVSVRADEANLRHMRELEPQLDRLIDEATARNRSVPAKPERDPAVLEPANDDGIDPFGFDATYDMKMRGVLELVYTRAFRVRTHAIDRIPPSGRCFLVADGGQTLDGLLLKMAVKLEHRTPRDVRWLSEDLAPMFGAIVGRLGAVRACRENAERLLAREALVASFSRLEASVEIAQRMQAPVVPVAIVRSRRAQIHVGEVIDLPTASIGKAVDRVRAGLRSLGTRA